jgi:hypothetical protein
MDPISYPSPVRPLVLIQTVSGLAGTENPNGPLPPAKTLAGPGPGELSFGPTNRASRLVEWATLPSGLPASYPKK